MLLQLDLTLFAPKSFVFSTPLAVGLLGEERPEELMAAGESAFPAAQGKFYPMFSVRPILTAAILRNKLQRG